MELIDGISKFLSKYFFDFTYDTFLFINFTEFNYTLKWVDDGAYGSKSKETGEWNGMLGEIIENVSVVTKIIWFKGKGQT